MLLEKQINTIHKESEKLVVVQYVTYHQQFTYPLKVFYMLHLFIIAKV